MVENTSNESLVVGVTRFEMQVLSAENKNHVRTDKYSQNTFWTSRWWQVELDNVPHRVGHVGQEQNRDHRGQGGSIHPGMLLRDGQEKQTGTYLIFIV